MGIKMAYGTPAAYVLDHRSKYNPVLMRHGFIPDKYESELDFVTRLIEDVFPTKEPDTYNEIMSTYTK
jgi:hypothetical protein